MGVLGEKTFGIQNFPRRFRMFTLNVQCVQLRVRNGIQESRSVLS